MARDGKTPRAAQQVGKKPQEEKEGEQFQLKKVFLAFVELPRIIRLVWSTDHLLTALMAVINLVRGFLPVLSVWVTGLLVDSIIHAAFSKTHTFGPIWIFVGMQLIIGVAQNFLNMYNNIVQQLLQEKIVRHVQRVILEKANTLDLTFFEDAEFYDKLRSATDEASYKPMQIIIQLFDLIKTTITLASMLFLLLQLAWWLAVISLLLPLPSFISNARYGWENYLKMRRESSARRRMQYLTHLMTVDSYNKEIKLFGLGNFFVKQFEDQAEVFYQENKKVVVGRYINRFAWTSLSTVTNAAIYIYVALRAVAGTISIGRLTVYSQAALQVAQNFQEVLEDFSGMYENSLFVNTFYEFLEYQPLILSPATSTPMERAPEKQGLTIEFRDVSFTYAGKDSETEAALQHVSFTINAGESAALVGRNGAGKTTIVKLLTRLYDPSSGHIFIGGRDIRDYDLDELRRAVGVIFQDYVTYYMSARENIGVGQIDEIENLELVESAAQKSGAHSIVAKLPDGYATMLGRWFKDGLQLSGGEWQKVALARAFMRNALILILDEPTSSLDAQAESEIFARFRDLAERKTAVFISHRFSTVRLADRILVIEQGKLKENGSHDELMALNGLYAELFNLQAAAYR